ncbi:sensor histidine kinase [Hymenobacter sp. UV11]|uniref:sensor histidine kinase n=1 Tax=Hymenobacter sp. UV11 TaxID=1849735 RepID=UPI00105BCA22|nr:histidine kinase [Hymenobacter sp. UV11]TDN38033.1 histidine kinase [Hymenobacter sp. UV11]TFZ64648.1 sensor histidine kinase [Hymenobacter sp. UV11]
MSAFSSRRILTPLIHVLAWGLLALTLLLFQPMQGRIVLPPQYWVKQGALLLMWVGAFYLTTRVSVPRLLLRGRTGWFVLALVVTAGVVVLVGRGLENVLHLPDLMRQAFRAAEGASRPHRPERPRGGYFDVVSMLITLLVLGIATAITVVQHWQQEAQLRERLDQQRVEAELSLLKAQINPHFFFNTLNNIYSLTLIDGERARAALHRLSRMMRYVLYDTASGQAQLSQEVAFIQDYITLMQLRLTDRVQVTFEHPEPVREVLIAPMMLLPFVENAFKHGVAATAPSHIYIGLRQPTAQQLEIVVRNTLFAKPSTDLAGSNGIGLVNTRRRLDLLYPGRYTLQVTEKTPDNEFEVKLSLLVDNKLPASSLPQPILKIV